MCFATKTTVGRRRSAGERLSRILSLAGVSRASFARAVGCSSAFAGMLAADDKRPGLALALKIERYTASLPEGPLRPSEWVGVDELTIEAPAA